METVRIIVFSAIQRLSEKQSFKIKFKWDPSRTPLNQLRNFTEQNQKDIQLIYKFELGNFFIQSRIHYTDSRKISGTLDLETFRHQQLKQLRQTSPSLNISLLFEGQRFSLRDVTTKCRRSTFFYSLHCNRHSLSNNIFKTAETKET